MLPTQPPTSVPQNTGLPGARQFNFESWVANLKYQLIPQRPLFHSISAQTIGATQVTIPHHLAKTPNVVFIQQTSLGTIYQSRAADATNIYLTADAASRTCNVLVAYIAENLK